MNILSVNKVSKTYTTRFGSHKVEALKNVSFDVGAHDFVGIIGHTGSG